MKTLCGKAYDDWTVYELKTVARRYDVKMSDAQGRPHLKAGLFRVIRAAVVPPKRRCLPPDTPPTVPHASTAPMPAPHITLPAIAPTATMVPGTDAAVQTNVIAPTATQVPWTNAAVQTNHMTHTWQDTLTRASIAGTLYFLQVTKVPQKDVGPHRLHLDMAAAEDRGSMEVRWSYVRSHPGSQVDIPALYAMIGVEAYLVFIRSTRQHGEIVGYALIARPRITATTSFQAAIAGELVVARIPLRKNSQVLDTERLSAGGYSSEGIERLLRISFELRSVFHTHKDERENRKYLGPLAPRIPV